MADISEDERKEAERVLYRYYREWVDQIVSGLAYKIFAGDIEDGDGLREQMEQNTDDALIYTPDHHMVIASSESISDAEERLEDMGGAEPSRVIAVIAVLAFQVDVGDAMTRAGMDPNDFNPGVWVRAAAKGEHGSEFAVRWDQFATQNPKDAEAWVTEKDDEDE